MAEAICPTCGKEVSDTATKCIFCGTRLYSDGEMLRPTETRKETPKAKEAGKGWIFFQLIGGLIAIIGILVYISSDKAVFSPFIILVGFCIFLLARIGARWHQG